MTPTSNPGDPALVRLFRRLSTEDLERLGAALSVAEFADGETAVREGDDDSALLVVIGGEAVVEKCVDPATGRTAVVGVLGIGDVLGEPTSLSGGRRAASLRARGTLRLLQLGHDAFRALAEREPVLALGVMSTFLETLSERRQEASHCLVILQDVSRRMSLAASVADVCRVVIEELARAMPELEGGLVALTDRGGLTPVTTFGLPAMPRPVPVDPHGPLMTTLISHTEGLVIGMDDPLARELTGFGYRWCLTAALDTVGWVALFANAVACPFTPHHRVLVGIVAGQASGAIVRSQARASSNAG